MLRAHDLGFCDVIKDTRTFGVFLVPRHPGAALPRAREARDPKTAKGIAPDPGTA